MTIRMSDIHRFDLSIYENYLNGKDVEWKGLARRVIAQMDRCVRRCQDALSARPIEYVQFTLLRAIETLQSMFLLMMLYTGNEALVMYHLDKSCLLFVEFMEQISHDTNHFLGLTSRDAAIFIYKKTLFSIDNQIRKDWKSCEMKIGPQLEKVKIAIDLYKTLASRSILTNSYVAVMDNDSVVQLFSHMDILSKIENMQTSRNRMVVILSLAVLDRRKGTLDIVKSLSFVIKRLCRPKRKTKVDVCLSAEEVEKTVELMIGKDSNWHIEENKLVKFSLTLITSLLCYLQLSLHKWIIFTI